MRSWNKSWRRLRRRMAGDNCWRLALRAGAGKMPQIRRTLPHMKILTAFVLSFLVVAATRADTTKDDSIKINACGDQFDIETGNVQIDKIITKVADEYHLKLCKPPNFGENSWASIKLRAVTWRQLFQVVLAPVGYGYLETKEGCIKIMTVDEIRRLPNEERHFEIYFWSPDQMAQYLTKIWGNKITIKTGPETLHITLKPGDYLAVSDDIAKVDKPLGVIPHFPRELHWPDKLPDNLPPNDQESFPETSSKTEERIYVIEWTDVDQMHMRLKKEFGPSVTMKVDRRSNAIIVTANLATLERFGSVVEYLDDKKWYDAHP